CRRGGAWWCPSFRRPAFSRAARARAGRVPGLLPCRPRVQCERRGLAGIPGCCGNPRWRRSAATQRLPPKGLPEARTGVKWICRREGKGTRIAARRGVPLRSCCRFAEEFHFHLLELSRLVALRGRSLDFEFLRRLAQFRLHAL